MNLTNFPNFAIRLIILKLQKFALFAPKFTKLDKLTELIKLVNLASFQNFCNQAYYTKTPKFASFAPKFTKIDELTELSEQANLKSFPNFAIRLAKLIKLSKNLPLVETLCLNVGITYYEGLLIYIILHYYYLFMCLRVKKSLKDNAKISVFFITNISPLADNQLAYSLMHTHHCTRKSNKDIGITFSWPASANLLLELRSYEFIGLSR